MPNENKPLSAASKRALNYTKGPERCIEFKEMDLGGDFAIAMMKATTASIFAALRRF